MAPNKSYSRAEKLENFNALCNSAFVKFEGFWQQFGISDEQWNHRSDLVVGHLTTLLEELLKEEQSLYDNMKEKVKMYVNDLRGLSVELGVQFNMPEENLSLLDKEELLKSQFHDLDKMKRRHLKEYKQLVTQEADLCSILGMPTTGNMNTSKVPRSEELRELKENVKMLEEEKTRRLLKFSSAKTELSTIMEKTEFLPETSFEREVVCYKDQEFVLSSENLQHLTEMVHKFQQRQSELEAEIKQAVDTVTKLWDRLNISEQERQEFLSRNSDFRQSTLNSLNEEIDRCEVLKKENLGIYIDKLRNELLDLWNKCYVSKEERSSFEALYCVDYSEELLDTYDQEVESIRNYYQKTQHIFQKIDERKQLWEVMQSLEQKAEDSNRYNNRGGNLLKEERQRKRILKDLPRLEEEITNAIEEYEETNNDVFLIEGKNFARFIKDQWDERINVKENKKLVRQKKRMLQINPSPMITSKRKICYTPASAPSKMSCLVSKMSCRKPNGPLTLSAMRNSSKQQTPTRNTILRRLKTNTPLPTFTLPNYPDTPEGLVHNMGEGSSQDTTTYSQFALEIDQIGRKKCRSSVLASRKKSLSVKIYRGGALRRSSNQSSCYQLRSSKASTSKSIFKTPAKLTTPRAGAGLPFLI